MMNSSEQHSRRKRGRPKANGRLHVGPLYRGLLLIYLYNQAREREPKHEAALAETLREFRKLHPRARASMTEVKRCLARYQPQSAQTAWKVVPTPDAEITRLLEICRQVGRPEGWKDLKTPDAQMTRFIETCRQLGQLQDLFLKGAKMMLDFGVGPRPAHPRINARDQSSKKKTNAPKK